MSSFSCVRWVTTRCHLILALGKVLALLLGKDQSSHTSRRTPPGPGGRRPEVPAVGRLAWSQVRFRRPAGPDRPPGTDPAGAAGQHAGIELRDVSKHYGTGSGQLVAAADDVSFAISRGGLIALSGASGSGKSTMLHLIGAIER